MTEVLIVKTKTYMVARSSKIVLLEWYSENTRILKSLFEATIEFYKVNNVSTNLIVGVTIDGEAPNIGFEAGPWKLLKDYLGHK